MATRPCPCGFLGDRAHACVCTPPAIERYRARISGPLLDRIDLHVPVPAVPYRELTGDAKPVDSATMRETIVAARGRQRTRLAEYGLQCNAQLTPRLVRRFARLDRAGERLLEQALTRLGLSARAYERILRVARTVADLEGADAIAAAHVAEAIHYRSLDRVGALVSESTGTRRAR